jgi:hypothetical protein
MPDSSPSPYTLRVKRTTALAFAYAGARPSREKSTHCDIARHRGDDEGEAARRRLARLVGRKPLATLRRESTNKENMCKGRHESESQRDEAAVGESLGGREAVRRHLKMRQQRGELLEPVALKVQADETQE